jgi:hypothetical protein
MLQVHPDEPQPDRIDYIVSCLRKGDVVALPTDTFYGLAVDPVNLHAVEQIYQIKTRKKNKPLSLLIASLAQAYELARDTDPLLDKLGERFWPGPLTIIVKAGGKLPLRSTANTGNVALHLGQPLWGFRVQHRGLCSRPAWRPNSTHRRRRFHWPGAAHHHRRSHSGRWALGDSARGRHPDARDCGGVAKMTVDSEQWTVFSKSTDRKTIEQASWNADKLILISNLHRSSRAEN